MKVFLAAALLLLSGCAELVTLAHLGVTISNSIAKHRELLREKTSPTPPEAK